MARVAYSLAHDAYLAADGFSHSESKALRKSPWHYRARRDGAADHPKDPTPQQFMGTLTHCATLEPGAFDARYMVGPEVDKRTKEWKTFAANCQAYGSEPITQLQREQAQGMAASVRALPDFAAIVADCSVEVSMWWECPATGILCKARPDVVRVYPPGMRVICESEERAQLAFDRGFALLADLKSTEDASEVAFARSVADYSYHTQAHWYMEGAEAALGVPVISFLFAVVEREYPYAAKTYTLDDNAMRVAGEINLAARKRYAECERDGAWPGYGTETTDISLPGWYMKRYLEGIPV